MWSMHRLNTMRLPWSLWTAAAPRLGRRKRMAPSLTYLTAMENHESAVRVRYAPSPTGHLHLGGLRTAFFNYLLARKYNGSFVLRIEDTDKTRQQPGAISSLLEAMEWAGLLHDEGPYRQDDDKTTMEEKDEEEGKHLPQRGDFGPYIQSQRLHIYKEEVNKLVENGHAYPCFCSSERLSRLREAQARQGRPTLYDRACMSLSKQEVDERIAKGHPYTIRLKVPPGETVISDVTLGDVCFPHSSIDDQVLMKSDGFPTYHLASVVDDHHMKISHVIRGQEWLSSTPKHSILYNAFGWERPNWVHLPLLVNEDKTKLSKRHGDVAVEQFKEKGYLPKAMLNFVALLGWHPGEHNTQEVFELDELVEQFDLKELNLSNCVVDRSKLNWLNTHHIRREIGKSRIKNTMSLSDINKLQITDPNDALVQACSFIAPEIPKRINAKQAIEISVPLDLSDTFELEGRSFTYGYTLAAMLAQHDRVSTFPDFIELVEPFFLPPQPDSVDSLLKHFWSTPIEEAMNQLYTAWEQAESACWEEPDSKSLVQMLKDVCKQQDPKLKPGQLMQPTRIALTGQAKGSALGRLIHLLGREECLNRLNTISIKRDSL